MSNIEVNNGAEVNNYLNELGNESTNLFFVRETMKNNSEMNNGVLRIVENCFQQNKQKVV